MKEELSIEGDFIYLRPVNDNDLTGNYAKWLIDKEVTKFMEFGNSPVTFERMKDYLNLLKNNKNLFLAIVMTETNQHVGNIRLGPIDWFHRRADIGVLVGERSVQGKGVASAAIQLVLNYAFNIMNLKRITLGVIAENTNAIRLYEKIGFVREGCLRSHVLCNGAYHDVILYGLMAEEFNKSKGKG